MARPKKRILLIDANELRLSARRFMLTTHGYAVFGAVDVSEALQACAVHAPEVAFIVCPIPGLARLVRDLHAMFPTIRTLLFAEGLKSEPENIYTDVMLHGWPPVSEILERLKVLAARKRGPHKMPVASVGFGELPERRMA